MVGEEVGTSNDKIMSAVRAIIPCKLVPLAGERERERDSRYRCECETANFRKILNETL